MYIHGYRQNTKTAREKSGAFRKMLKKKIECDFITAPHRVPPGNMGSAAWAQQDELGQQASKEEEEKKTIAETSSSPAAAGDQEVTSSSSTSKSTEAASTSSSTASPPSTDDPEDPGERGWWFSREDDWFKSDHVSDVDKGFDESVDMIVSALEGNSYDGILGFSQGACLVSMLCLMQQQQGKHWFKFAMLFSGFPSRSSKHDKFYSGGVKAEIPSFHMYGETDKVVPGSSSEELLQYFADPVFEHHPGGHFIPAASAQKKSYLTFLEEMKKLCL